MTLPSVVLEEGPKLCQELAGQLREPVGFSMRIERYAIQVNDPLSQFIFFWTSSTVFHIDRDESCYDQNQKYSPVMALGCDEQILVKISAKSVPGFVPYRHLSDFSGGEEDAVLPVLSTWVAS